MSPGWYPDPSNRSILRWWDGHVWTQHTKAAAANAYPAPPQAAAPPPPPPSPVAPQAPAQHGRHAGAFQAINVPQTHTAPIDAAIRDAEARLAALSRELESVEEAIHIQSFGFYRPKYGFDSSSEYTERLSRLRDEQKQLIKSGAATHCDTKWVVAGSEAEGKKMIQRMAKLMLRAFNGECDAAIGKVKYDNVEAMSERITKSCKEINLLGHSNRVMITTPYYQSKLAELHLVHEHREKVQEEKDEQKRIRESLREEEKARAEIEKAQATAERDEATKQRALEKARAELAEASAAAQAMTAQQHAKLEGLVARLENELKDALDRKAKAIARAQLTKSGHVYVLSNVGSFGHGIYKIGLTRRLDPYERVDELGDASVPFQFDVHAVIFAKDAPALEHALHKEFASRRVNMVNHRKEYFRVTIDEIAVAVQKHHGLVSLVTEAEAEEWRKTQSMIDAGVSATPSPSGDVDAVRRIAVTTA